MLQRCSAETIGQTAWSAAFARIAAVACAVMAALAPALGQEIRAPSEATVALTILAINDFHGNLKPPGGGIVIADSAGGDMRVAAGGAERLATLVKQQRAKQRNSIFVAAGDLVGASPLLSALFHDEPTVEALSLMGLDLSAVGNHEFDKGQDELKRLQNGGCAPSSGVGGAITQFRVSCPLRPFAGATYHYLAASTVVRATGKTLFPAYEIRTFDGVPVAFVGLTLRATPEVVSPSGVAGLVFGDEADAINALVPELAAQGVAAIVVLIHQGGETADNRDYNGCPGMAGPIVDIVNKLDRAVGVVVSGHTHRAYNCIIDGRLVTSADKYGTLLTRIDVALDPATRRIVGAHADNIIVSPDTVPDATLAALIAGYDETATQLADRKAGTITATLSREPNRAGKSELGDVVADAQLAATAAPEEGGAVIAFTNPGGVRTGIGRNGGGAVTFGELFAAQPFGNTLVTLSLTGAQIKALLEQQWQPEVTRILQVSRGFTYVWYGVRPAGDRIPANGIRLDGRPLDPAASYRVTVNGFLVDGGDGFSVFRQGTDQRITGSADVDALDRYFAANSPVSPPPLDRIGRGD